MTGEMWKLVEFAIWGLLGGLIGAIGKAGRLTLPHVLIEKTRSGVTRRVIDLGFVAAPFIGSVIGAAVDGRPLTALAFGVTAGFAGPAFVKVIAETTLRLFGYAIRAMAEEMERRPGVGDGAAPARADGGS